MTFFSEMNGKYVFIELFLQPFSPDMIGMRYGVPVFSGGGDAKKDSITKEVLGVGDGLMDGGRGG